MMIDYSLPENNNNNKNHSGFEPKAFNWNLTTNQTQNMKELNETLQYIMVKMAPRIQQDEDPSKMWFVWVVMTLSLIGVLALGVSYFAMRDISTEIRNRKKR